MYLPEKSPMFDQSDGIFSTGLEIIKYFKNDRIPFFKLLSSLITDDMNVFMAICESVDDDNLENNVIALRLILEESALTPYDIYTLLLFKNKEYKTALFCALGCYYKNIAHIFFDAIPSKYLVKLLRQETEKADQFCAMECRKKPHMLRLLNAVLAEDDRVLGLELKSKKEDLRRDVKKCVEKYEIYCTTKEACTTINNKCEHLKNIIAEKGKDLPEEKRAKFEEICANVTHLLTTIDKDRDKLNIPLFMSACYLGQYETIQELWTLSSGAAKSK
eukprot:211008_1